MLLLTTGSPCNGVPCNWGRGEGGRKPLQVGAGCTGCLPESLLHAPCHGPQVSKVKAKVNTANVSSFCILLLVWTTFCGTFASQRSGGTAVGAGPVVAVVALDVAIFLAALVLCFAVAYPPGLGRQLRQRLMGMGRPEAVAVAICGSTKTVALGVPLINVMYGKVPYAGGLWGLATRVVQGGALGSGAGIR